MKTFLKCMPHAQATVEKKEDGSVILTSYDTKTATLTSDGLLSVHCWCSPTTRRHVAAFIDEYVHGLKSKEEQRLADTGSYQTGKMLYERQECLDITTGELKKI